MQRTTDRLFTPAERRLALISDLPGVTDARPLS